MCPTANTRGLSSILGYTPPKFHDGKQCYVDFYALDPATGALRRKKYNVNGALKKRERQRLANELIARLQSKLEQGWTPYADATSERGFVKFDSILDKYLQFVEKLSRKKTSFSYTSRVNILREYIATMRVPIVYAYQYDTAFVTGFLDYIYLERKCGPRTRNNYLGWCSAFASFMLEREFINANPCTKISKLREDPKRRTAITEADLQRIFDYTHKTDPHFCLACLMEYFTFIRPTELSYLKIENINVATKTVFVPGTISKNRRDGYVTLNDTILKYMIQLGVFSAPGCDYIFSKNFKPGEERLGPDHFTKKWKTVIKALKLPDSYQFYSLKDSGIRDLANKEGVVNARDQARHSDISTTNKYLSSSIGRAPEAAKGFKGAVDLSELTRQFDTSQP